MSKWDQPVLLFSIVIEQLYLQYIMYCFVVLYKCILINSLSFIFYFGWCIIELHVCVVVLY